MFPRGEVYVFGEAMKRHNVAWLTGGVVGFVSFLSSFFFTSTKIPPVVMAVLSFLMMGKAAFNVWREQYRRTLRAELQLRRLQNPEIQASVDGLVLTKEDNLNSPGVWVWSMEFMLRIIPAPDIAMALTDSCEIAIDVLPGNSPLFKTRIANYWHMGGIRPLPVDVRESSAFKCEISIDGPALLQLPDRLKATIRLADARSSWSKQITVALRREGSARGDLWIA